MIINPSEVKVESPPPQDNVVTNLSQDNVVTNLSQQVENKPTEAAEDPNWKAFREARKQDRLQREAAEKRALDKHAEAEALKAAMESILNKPSHNQESARNQYAVYPEEESEDERIEKKVQAAIAKKEAEYERALAEREKLEYPRRLVQTFSDFNQTISQENLDYLDYHYPEVSRPLQRLGDDYDKWSDIYKAIKKFVPNNTTAKKDAARAEANFNKPKSISSTGLTQPPQGIESIQSVKARREARWEEMERIRKGIG